MHSDETACESLAASLKVAQRRLGKATTPDFDYFGQSLEIRVRVVDSLGNTGEFRVFVEFEDDRSEDADGDGLTEAEEEDHPDEALRTTDALWDSDDDEQGLRG